MAGGDHGSGVDPTAVLHFRAGRAAPSPAPGDGALEVAFSLDAALVDVFPTTLRSLTAHTVVPLRVTLLTRGIGPRSVAAISRDAPGIAVAWFAAEALHYPPLDLLGHTTISTMDRLWLPRVMGWADRVVYLDIDVAVQDDIRPLHDRDLEGRPLAARPSLHPDWRTGTALAAALVPRLPAEAAAAFHDEFGPPAAMGFPCFNAGVLVLDLVALRAGDFTRHTLRLARDYRLHDQHALNLFCRGRFAPLEPRWNHFVGQETLADPAIIHYAGLRKPWLPAPCPLGEAWLRHRTARGATGAPEPPAAG